MLRELHIKNYAIVDEVSISLSSGFNVITGETGAGKSILVGALLMILGERSPMEGVRHGAKEALLEGFFDPLPADSSVALPPQKPDHSDGLILQRILSSSAKNRAYLNGAMARLSTLKVVGQSLVEIHGQQGQQLLTNRDHQRSLLDAYAQLTEDRLEYRNNFRTWTKLMRERECLIQKASESKREQSILQYQLTEIREARLFLDEEEKLEKEAVSLRNWESILEKTERVYAHLSGEEGLLSQLDEIGRDIKELNTITMDAESEIELWETAGIQLKELVALLRSRRQEEVFRPGKLEEVEARLYLIQGLKTKYQRPVSEILSYQKALEETLSEMTDNEMRIEEIGAEIDGIHKKLLEAAAVLSKKRNASSLEFVSSVQKELCLLGMEETRFKILIKKIPFSENGCDEIEFQIGLDGEVPQDMAKIASGGELSRIMLALKVVLAEVDPVPTLVFDEIDAGVGGGIAERVGRRLSTLALKYQVLCITHLPQIAALADHHYFVEKRLFGERMVTSICKLNPQERIEEVARMLGGVKMTSLTRHHAEEMIQAK
ncbi:MAG: DNA repair protein RecN [Nitrospiria bacterium]